MFFVRDYDHHWLRRYRAAKSIRAHHGFDAIRRSLRQLGKSFTSTLALGFLITTACNAAWFFAIALPASPAVILPAPPPKNADVAVVDRYYRVLDKDERVNSKHIAAVEMAAAIEASVTGTLVLVLLAPRIK